VLSRYAVLAQYGVRKAAGLLVVVISPERMFRARKLKRRYL